MKNNTLFPQLIGCSPPMRALKDTLIRAAGTDATVLLQGESGTGKELVAKAIHTHSQRSSREFLAINCGAIPESLMESMLFGYEQGAFSGAKSGGQQGLLEQARGGTFFLDEVAEMPLMMQVKLLRTLQEHKVRRLGGKAVHSLDVRIIAASNSNLRDQVRLGNFRQDLFFRLDVIPVLVPPLRERKGDVRLLAVEFLRRFSEEKGQSYRIAPELLKQLEAYSWPGNVRELKNFIEYGVTFCNNGLLTPKIMETRFRTALQECSQVHAVRGPEGRQSPQIKEQDTSWKDLLERFGRHLEGKKALAAHLGISLSTLYRNLAKAQRESDTSYP